MFKRFVKQCCKVFSVLVSISSIGYGATSVYDPSDPRHQFVSSVRERYAGEITARKSALGTYYASVALVDLATKRLEAGNFTSSEPDWSLVIHRALSGYGFSKGVADTSTLMGAAKPTEADLNILRKGYALSSSYLQAQGFADAMQPSDVYTQSASAAIITGHVSALNQAAAAVPEDVHTAVQSVVSRVQSLAQLNTFNAWFAHERFWAAGGVIDPHVHGQLKASFAAFRGTPFGFLNDLTLKLDAAIRAIPGVPGAEAIENLVRQSQQILLTIAAGTPLGESYSRLNSTTAADWQIIRKALFLALSVTSNPDKAGDTY